MYDLDNERKLNPEGRNDGRTEWRKGVALYAPAILWRGHNKNQIWCDPSNMVKLEIVELKLLENVDLCSCYVIQHFCDIVFVPSSYDYEGLCNTID